MTLVQTALERTLAALGLGKTDFVRAEDVPSIMAEIGTIDVTPTGSDTPRTLADWMAIVQGGTATFRPKTYLSNSDYAAVTQWDYASQDESAVTTALRSMHDDMMAAAVAADAAGYPLVIVAEYIGGFAVNDELFSETFAESLWGLPQTTGIKFVFRSNGAVFQATNWSSHKAARTSGYYADLSITDPVPTVMFRWEQQSLAPIGPFIEGHIVLRGEEETTDPMGFKARNLNGFATDRLTVERFANVGKWIENINNSREWAPVIAKCGFQPTLAGGNGFVGSTTFSTVNNADGTSTVTASAAIFSDPEHVGESLSVGTAGVSGGAFVAQITSVTSPTVAVVDAECTTDVSGKPGSFAALTGSISADSATLVLDGPTTTVDFIGRYVMVLGARSKIYTNQDLLVTRVTAQTGNTLTLATQAGATVSSVPVTVAPAKFLGVSDDFVLVAGTAISGAQNNDYQVFYERLEATGSPFRPAPVSAVYQRCFKVNIAKAKHHATSQSFNDFGGAWCAVLSDYNTLLRLESLQIAFNIFSPGYGKIVVVGNTTHLQLPDLQPIDSASSEADDTAIFYVNPRSAGNIACKVGWSGHINAGAFPSGGQAIARYGANGNETVFYEMGPIVRSGAADYYTQPYTIATAIKWTGSQSLLADDTVMSLTPPNTSACWLKVWVATGFTDAAVDLYCNCDATPQATSSLTGANAAVFEGTALTDGTSDGTDGRLNIAVNDGVILIKNRLGGAATIRWAFEF